MAPEIVDLTASGYNFKADIWAVGCLIYMMLVGFNPFYAEKEEDVYEKIRDLNIDFPSDCNISELAKDLILNILCKDPSKLLYRYYSVF
jgi:serine/threonine protein kinase